MKIKKIWIKQTTKENHDGELLQMVKVYFSKVKGSNLTFIEK